MPLVLSGTNGISANDTNWAFQTNSTGAPIHPNIPAFMASVNSSYTVSCDTPNNYTNVIFNNGNYYNSATSTFTVPVSGRYVLFGNTRMNANVSYVYTEPYINGTRTYSVWGNKALVGLGTGADSGFTASSFCVLLSLTANDAVRVGSGFAATTSTIDSQSYWCMYLIG